MSDIPIGLPHQHFADSLRNLRESHGFTQSDLAKVSGISQSTVSALETGRQRPWPTTRKALAQAFEMSLKEFDKVVMPHRQPVVPMVEILTSDVTALGGGDASSSYLQGMVRLVNQLHFTQERLQRSETGFGLIRRFFDDLPVLFWETDPDLRVIRASGWARRRHEVWAELIGRTIPEFQQHTGGAIPLPPLEPHQNALAGHSVSVLIEWGVEQWNVALEPIREGRDMVTGVLGLGALRGMTD